MALVWCFMSLSVAALAATTASTLVSEELFGAFHPVWFACGAATTLVFLTAMTVSFVRYGRRQRQHRAAMVRDRNKARAWYEAEAARAAAEINRAHEGVAEAIRKARMEDPTYALPLPIVHTRTEETLTRRATISTAAYGAAEALQAAMRHDWQSGTGEIRMRIEQQRSPSDSV